MPTYQYVCTECGGQLEAVQKFTDDPLSVHEACGGRLRKVFSPVGIVFKGSGFYRNDSRDKPKAATGASSSDAAKSDAAGKGDSAKADSGFKADSAKSGASSSSSESSKSESSKSSGSSEKSGAKPAASSSSSSSGSGAKVA